MTLAWLIALPILGGVAAWLAGRRSDRAARWISLASLAAALALALRLWPAGDAAAGGRWLAELHAPWIPRLGVGFHLAADGLSLPLVLLTLVLGLAAVAASWMEIRERVGFFHLSLLWSLAGLVGVFTAIDLVLFYLFWELMLVPIYLLIAIWGHERRLRAAVKLMLFTQGGGLLMLVSILGLGRAHALRTGEWSFDYERLLGTALAPETALWLLLGFLAAFAVKLPAVPLHTWLPDAHTEAPTAGSVILAGVLLKTGGYGLIRFAVPLFPEAARLVAPWAMALGALGILYGAVLALGQSDLKRLVAYTSVSHLGFVLLGVFAWSEIALQGAVVQMLAHGVSTGALFVLAGLVQERTHTRELDRLGGLAAVAPRMTAVALVFAMASLGLPGLGNFVGEFLTLLGTWQVSRALAVAAALGLVVATLYALRLIQEVFHGPRRADAAFADLTGRETAVLGALAVLAVALGVFPLPILDAAAPALDVLRGAAVVAGGAG